MDEAAADSLSAVHRQVLRDFVHSTAEVAGFFYTVLNQDVITFIKNILKTNSLQETQALSLIIQGKI